MIVVLTDENCAASGQLLCDRLLAAGQNVNEIPLNRIEISPCVSCGACNKRPDGQCVARDDGERVYPSIAAADALVVVTPVVFGGYSFKTKRVLDKLGTIMDRRYFMHEGELAKGGLIGRQFCYVAVGIQSEPDEQEASEFKQLVSETIHITRGKGAAIVIRDRLSNDDAERIAKEVMSA